MVVKNCEDGSDATLARYCLRKLLVPEGAPIALLFVAELLATTAFFVDAYSCNGA